MRKLKIVVVLNLIFNLVTPNPLQGFQSCPLTHHQNYININPSSVPTHFDAYPPQIQNQQDQPPNTYEEQLNRLYLENILSNAISNSYANSNLMLNQNQIDLSRYVANPSENLANAFNNYGFRPQTPLSNQSVGNGINKYLPQTNNGYENNLWIPSYSNTYNDDIYRIVTNILSNKKETRNSSSDKEKSRNQDQGNKRQKNIGNNKRKVSGTSKKHKLQNYNTDSKTLLRDNDEEYNERSKPISRLLNTENNEEYLNKGRKGLIKNSRQKLKNKGSSKFKSNINENEEISDIQMKDSRRKHISLSQIETNECLDINEDCTDLENRRTRNNYNSDVTQHQFSGIPKEFTESMGYMNNYMPNQNFNIDLIGGQGKFPYNFDYLYQTPQNSNSQSNGSDKRRTRRRKKKKPKTNNETEPSSNNQTKGKHPYDLIVELLPKVNAVDSTTESIPTEVTTIKEIETEKTTIEQKTHIDDTTIRNLPALEVKLDSDNAKEHSPNDLSREYAVPFVHDNRIDDYYPDFTLDNIYLSKEDNDWTFHGRHYYSSDDKPESSREKRKYESNYRRKVLEKDNQDILRLNGLKKIHVDNPKELKTSQEEIIFRTPPELEFPDFKTQMVNKDSYRAGDDTTSAYSSLKTRSKLDKNNNNTVETVYAHSKVVKYGAAETDDKEQSFDYIKNKIYTGNEDTTVVVAKSLS